MTETLIHNKQDAQILTASIEVQPKQIIDHANLSALFPRGTQVYLTDVGIESLDVFVAAAKRLRDLGNIAVPHIASRRIISVAALEDRVKRLALEAGVNDMLLIGGDSNHPAGPFTSSLQVLETGIFDRYGIKRLGVAGHPEGNPDFSDDIALNALRLKAAFAQRTGAEMRIVTQFGFDPSALIEWTEALARTGIDLPVHLGIAGPAKLTTLIKYAMRCGVGNSLSFLTKRSSLISSLTKSHSPEEVLHPIEQHVSTKQHSAISQIHVFPFGGLQESSDWLQARGSWQF